MSSEGGAVFSAPITQLLKAVVTEQFSQHTAVVYSRLDLFFCDSLAAVILQYVEIIPEIITVAPLEFLESTVGQGIGHHCRLVGEEYGNILLEALTEALLILCVRVADEGVDSLLAGQVNKIRAVGEPFQVMLLNRHLLEGDKGGGEPLFFIEGCDSVLGGYVVFSE